MGWTNDANNTPFTPAVKPKPALRLAQAGRPVGVMHQTKKPRPWGGRGWVQTGCRRCPDASTLPEDG
jgi:hypothetical protein